MGLLLCIVVHAANIQERASGKLVLEKASNRGLSRLQKVLADDWLDESLAWFEQTLRFIDERGEGVVGFDMVSGESIDTKR